VLNSPIERIGLIAASVVAKQLICEYMALLEAFEGFRRGPGLGRRVARKLVIERKGESVAKVSVIGEVLGVPVAASPDIAVLDSSGKVVALIKAQVRRSLKIYRSDIIYLYVSAAVLESEGVMSHNVILAVAVAVDEDSLKSALESLISGRIKPMLGEGFKVYTEVYERDRVLQALEPLMALWRGDRPPKPSPSPVKCASCPYLSSCSYAAKTK
jgi:CRISPR/Cas system-associated exonuclease Cas4 (RecB family)